MKPRNDIQIELESLGSYLAGLEKTNVFKIPAGYFDQLPDTLLEKCLFQSSAKSNFSEVPGGYFDSLADNILSKIKALESENAATELRKLSPMLYALQNEEVYTVPRDYFKEFAENMLAKIPVTTKVISMKPVALWKYAAAAVVTGAIAVSSLWLSDTTKTTPANPVVAIEKSATNEVIKESAQYTSATQIQNEVAALPNDVIINYLENTGTAADLELIASTIDQQELPSQEDYLLDENALNKYLEEINSNDLNN